MDVAAAMATDNLGAMNLAGSSVIEFGTHEMGDCQNDATVTFTKHTGIVSQRYLCSCLQLLHMLPQLICCHFS